MIVLALNCGSSSLKFELLDCRAGASGEPRTLASGLIERIGEAAAVVLHAAGAAALRGSAPIGDHGAAVRRGIGLKRAAGGAPPGAPGPRGGAGGGGDTR